MFSSDVRLSPIVKTYEPYSLTSGSLKNHEVKAVKSYHNEAPSCRCYIIPPHITQKLEEFRAQSEQEHIRNSAGFHRTHDEAFRHLRKATIKTEHAFSFHWPHDHDDDGIAEREEVFARRPDGFDPNTLTRKLVRLVYDAQNKELLPGKFVISTQGQEGLPGYQKKGNTHDEAAIQALDNALAVFLFYLKQYHHNSIDGKGMPINSCIHFGANYENAFWDGTEMVYGDGSELFDAFVKYLDVVGHEMSHGVTGDRLIYKGEAGALNEHFSDVMGYLVYMFKNNLDVHQADWLLANGILKFKGDLFPLRSFAAPGTAYDIPELGKDPQPAKYGDLFKGSADNGGVHINSGIPNHAFYLFATALGGYAWEKAGLIWFSTMMKPEAFRPNAKMEDFAKATILTAVSMFSHEPRVVHELLKAWTTVEVLR